MRHLDSPDLKPHLVEMDYVTRQIGKPFDRYNAALIFHHNGNELRVIASAGAGWDHVSVSLKDRCPTWLEMEFVRKKLFLPDEVVWQYHLPDEHHVNNHPYALHMWRKKGFKMPRPPKKFV